MQVGGIGHDLDPLWDRCIWGIGISADHAKIGWQILIGLGWNAQPAFQLLVQETSLILFFKGIQNHLLSIL